MKRNGFTLIELTVVIAVIGILTTMAVTSFGGSYRSASLKESARGLAATARYAQHYAVMRQRTCRLVLTDDQSDDPPGYQVQVQSTDPDDDTAFLVLRGGPAKPASLPKNIRFGDVVIDSADAGESRAVLFRPTGDADAAAIQVTDGARTWSILIEPNTGRVELVEQAVTQTPNLREDLDV